MHLKLKRNKDRSVLLTVAYRVFRPLLFFLSSERKLRLFLDLEWVFARFVQEESFRFYSKDTHPHPAATLQWLLERLEPGQRVLDLGCSEGYISSRIAEAGYPVVGVDHSLEKVTVARTRYPRAGLSFECADAKAYLEKCQERFDVLVLSHVLEHLDQPEEFLKGLVEHFQKIFIEVPNFESSYQNLYRAAVRSKLNYTDSDHVTEFDRAELEAMVRRAGLVTLDAEERFGVMRLWCERQNQLPHERAPS